MYVVKLSRSDTLGKNHSQWLFTDRRERQSWVALGFRADSCLQHSQRSSPERWLRRDQP